MPSYRRRRNYRRRSGTPFRAWGRLLGLLFVVSLLSRQWSAAWLIGSLLVPYWLFAMPAKCWVQTSKGNPCGQNVQGLMSGCKHHPASKWGFPMITGNGFLRMPTVMWRNPNHRVIRLQPAGFRDAGRHEEAPLDMGQSPHVNTLNVVVAWLTAVGVAIALAAFVRDVIAG